MTVTGSKLLRHLEPFLVPLLAGALAILGGYVASRHAFEAERTLREEQRLADTRAAARMLDLELANRLRLTLNGLGVALPRGDIKDSSVRSRWECINQQLESALLDAHRQQSECGRAQTEPAWSPDPRTRLRPVAWSLEDRHLLASRLRGDRWFQITVAVDAWSALSERHRSLGELLRHLQKHRRSTASAAETVTSLTRARIALAPYVVLEER